MNLKKEIEKDNFSVEQKLIHYSIGEGLNIYNLRATAKKRGGSHSELVRDTYGICFDDELHDIYWFVDFETKAKHIYVMKKAFQKAYSKMNCSFPEFHSVFEKNLVDPQKMFEVLSSNDGDIENFIIVEYDEYEERCRFYKEHSDYAQKWMPHLEPFNHKHRMVTDKEYDIDALYEFLSKNRNVVIPSGIEEVHDVFDNSVIRVLNFYVKIHDAIDAKRDLFEDLPKTAIDISAYKYPPMKIHGKCV